MPRVKPAEVTWIVCVRAKATVDEVRQQIGADRYEASVGALRVYLCNYFSSDAGCVREQGDAISPVASGVARTKGLKVRWPVPGRGKRDSLRLGILAFCDAKVVKIAYAEWRSNDPQVADLADAFSKHDA